ncbi:MAG: hypothetical protein WBA45_08855 [Microthrixaceae bacterium]
MSDFLEPSPGDIARHGLSSHATDALRRRLQRDRIGELLADMDSEAGAIPEDLMEEARQIWRGPVDQ